MHRLASCRVRPGRYSPVWQPASRRRAVDQRAGWASRVEPAIEADSGCVAALIVLAGAASAAAYAGSHQKWVANLFNRGRKDALAALQLENANPADFAVLRSSGNSVTYSYTGSSSSWKGKQLRLRHDDAQALILDRVASGLLADGFNLDSELVTLTAQSATTLLEASSSSTASTTSGRAVAALKLAASVPDEVREGGIVTMELRPGSGVVDLYGLPGTFSLQEDSEMKRDALSRAGKYSARDIFSGRPERVHRALHALREDPQDVLRIFVDGKSIPKEAMHSGIDGNLSMPLLVEVMVESLDQEGKDLLMALLRAQCSAGAVTNEQARQLGQIYRQHSAQPEDTPLISVEALRTAFKRGFWTLSPDDSGKAAREREGERLLERARRELWKEGSASRGELEAGVRIFLCRNLLGRAANAASVQLSIVRARPGCEDVLRDLRFKPSAASAGSGAQIWWRLNLLDFEMPSERILRT